MHSRIHYFDYARGIGIILVILGHIQYISKGLRIFIVSFHMPLFFFLSGMLLFVRGEKDRSLREVFLKKARSMLYPYFVFSILDIIIYIGYYCLTGRDGGLSTVISAVIQTLTFYGYSVLWFLPTLFGSELLFLFLLKHGAGRSGEDSRGGRLRGLFFTLESAAAAFGAFFLNSLLEQANAVHGMDPAFSAFHLFAVAVLRILFCMVFTAAGYGAACLWSRAGSLSPVSFSPLTIPADLFIGADLLAFCWILGRLNGMTDLHYLLTGNPLLYFITACSGSLGIILLCKAFEGLHRMPVFRLLAYYGRNSLIVMVTHLNFYVLLTAEIGGQHFTKRIQDGQGKTFLFILLTLFFTLVGEIVLIEIVNRFFPFLLGKPAGKKG